MPTGLIALKYLAWLLTVGIPFVGTWFFDFTTTDKATGKKTLTAVGAKVIYLSALSLVCALAVSVWTDYRSAASERRAQQAKAHAEKLAEEERSRTADFQMQSLKAHADTHRLLALNNRNINLLPASEQEVVRETVSQLSSIEDLRREYPKLFARAASATTFGEVVGAITEAHYTKISERVRTSDLACSNIRIERLERGLPNGYPGATFKAEPTDSKSGELLFFTYMVDGAGIRLSMNWISSDPKLSFKTNPFENGYYYEFVDGSRSGVVRCDDKRISGICEVRTGNGGQALDVYRLLQSKRTAKVVFGDRSFTFSPTESQSLQNTLACITP